MSDLKNSLKSEREALIAAGDPDCLRYMRKVVDLRVNLRVLSVELRRSNALLRERSREDLQSSNCWRKVSLLNDFLQNIDTETERLRVEPMHRYCRIGGVSGTRYAARVAELEAIVKRSIGVIAALKQDSSGMTSANGRRATEELADSIERLCRKLRDLEVLDDRASLQSKIDRLEASVMRLKLELAARDERIRVLSDEHVSVRSSLERDRERHEKIVADMRAENESLREGVSNGKREISELSREREHSTTAMRLMRAEIDAVRKELRDLRDDREALLRETEGMRNILRERTDKEIEDIIAERDTLRGRLDAEVTVLKTKLEIASDENAKLKSIIAASDWAGEERPDKMKSSGVNGRDNGEGTWERARDPRDELVERLKAESNETKISLGEANEQIDHLRRALDKAVGDRMRLEGEISDLKSNEQSLTHRLNVRTSVCEAATRESERATAENKALASQVKQLGNENEQLAAKLSELKTEKELLARAVVDVDKELQQRVDEFKSEHSGLQERINEREDAAKNLEFQLKRVRVELENMAAEVTRVRAENARISGDLEAESLRKGEAEERVRVLLTEKNELATRINELNGVSVQALRGRLNKAEAENEYFSIELNKSRLENERMRAKNALLQVTCDKRERDYGTLRRERDEARGLANEIGSECRVLGNQLRIQRMKYEALRFAAATLYHENTDRKSHLKKIDNPRYPLAKAREPGSAAARNDVKHKRDYSDALCAAIKDELGDVEFKAESDTRAVHDIKTRIKDKPKSTKLKSLTIGDKILQLDVADSKPKDRQLTRTAPVRRKDENSPLAGIEEPRPFEEVVNVLDGHVAVHIFYKSDHLDRPKNPAIIGDEKSWSAVAVVDRLEVENTALKLELNILRSSLNSSAMEAEKLRTMAYEVKNEMQSLRLELMTVKSERMVLGSRLERYDKALEAREPARASLKHELTTSSATSNFNFRKGRASCEPSAMDSTRTTWT
ncbi:Laminin subunit alpha-2 [Ooceraea biroi]|nr:Laminin subunit alpha-2 [Ooceraea biroi]